MGAWLETRDQLSVLGRGHGRAVTVNEAASAADPAIASALHTLAPIVDRALYASAEPDDDLVAAAWGAESMVARGLKDESNLGQRVKAAIDPRPLVDAARRSRSS